MERDRKQIQKLVYFVAPAVLLWVTFSASFCYELGQNGLYNINWSWVFQTCIPVIIISVSMLLHATLRLKADKIRK